jgi:hypothetical protein
MGELLLLEQAYDFKVSSFHAKKARYRVREDNQEMP